MKRPRFRVRTLMVIVAGASLVLLVASQAGRPDGITDKRIVVPVACIVAVFYGIEAMRHPWAFLVPLVGASMLAPRVDHPSQDVVNGSAARCLVAWMIGAPAGWVARHVGRRAERRCQSAEESPSRE
jgi:hypothetical protein